MREQSGIYSGYAERGELRQQGNVPNLRFPEFTEDWVNNTFGEIAKGLDYGMNAAAKPFDGMNKYIRITDIDESSSLYRGDEIVSPDGKLEECYLVKENDILLARTGASTGKSYLYRNSDGILYFAGFLIRANIEKHNPLFVFSQLHTHKYWKWVSIMSTRSGQPGINSQEFASFPIYTTSIQEENKIAHFLKLLDERIATQNKIIKDLKKLKVAIRDKELNVIRKRYGLNRQILEVLDYEQPSRYIVSNTKYSDDSNLIPVLTANKAFILGYTDEPFGIYDKGECIILDDFTLDCKLVDFAFKIKSSAIKILTSKNGISLRYVYEYLNHIGLETTEHKRHYISEIEPMLIAYPDNNEVVISFCDLMDKFDQKIEIENKYLQSLLAQKVYLLSNMFI